jgi:hypothetical protein
VVVGERELPPGGFGEFPHAKRIGIEISVEGAYGSVRDFLYEDPRLSGAPTGVQFL